MVQAGGFNGRFLMVMCWILPPAMMHQDDITFFNEGILMESWVGGKINPRYVRKYAQDLFPHKAGMSCKKSSRTRVVDFFLRQILATTKKPGIFACGLDFVEKSGDVSAKNRSHKVFAIRPFRWFSWLISLNGLEFSVCNLEPKQGA